MIVKRAVFISYERQTTTGRVKTKKLFSIASLCDDVKDFPSHVEIENQNKLSKIEKTKKTTTRRNRRRFMCCDTQNYILRGG